MPLEMRLYLWGISGFSSAACSALHATTTLASVAELVVFQLLGKTLHTPTEAVCLLLLKAKLYLSRGLEIAHVQAEDILSLENNTNDIGMLLPLFSLILGTSKSPLFKEWAYSQ